MTLARLRMPKVMCFITYVEYRPNRNTNNIMQNRSHQGEVTYKRGRIKEGSLEGEYG
jgi:hypothetical protein